MILNAHNDKYNRMWFKEGRFPINIHGKSLGYLFNGKGIRIKLHTLVDSDCSKPILSRRFYEQNEFLHPIHFIR